MNAERIATTAKQAKETKIRNARKKYVEDIAPGLKDTLKGLQMLSGLLLTLKDNPLTIYSREFAIEQTAAIIYAKTGTGLMENIEAPPSMSSVHAETKILRRNVDSYIHKLSKGIELMESGLKSGDLDDAEVNLKESADLFNKSTASMKRVFDQVEPYLPPVDAK